jgi:predicted N-acetyltransferase YhbS
MTFDLSPEGPDDAAAIETLLDAAFGADRHAKTAYRYRDGIAAVAALASVARRDGVIVGSIRYWPVVIGLAATPALLLGPLAIDPGRQGQGIGRALMGVSLAAAADLGHGVVVLVGDEAYYGKFGFAPAGAHGIFMPDERLERLLVRELAPHALEGVSGAVRRADAVAPLRARTRHAAVAGA